MPVVVLHVMPDLAVGGGQMLLLRHASAHTSACSHHAAFVRPPIDMRDRYERAGIACHDLGGGGPWSSGRALARVARRVGAGVIHANNTPSDRRAAYRAGWLTGLPVITTLHAEMPVDRPGAKATIRALGRGVEHFLARRVLRRAIAVSEHVRQCWLPRLPAMLGRDGGVEVVHPGLDLAAFDLAARVVSREELRRGLGVAPDAPVVIHVGRLAHGKGQAELVPAMLRLRERVPSARAWIVGEGPQRAELEARIKAAGLGAEIRLLGERGDVPALLHAADVMTFPSFSEGFGLAPLEAMAAGRPVVAFDLPSLREFVGAGGVLVGEGGGEALGAAAGEILGVPGAAERLGRAGRKIVEERFRIERFVGDMERIYLAVASEARP